MASKTTPSLNKATKRRTKRFTAGINSRYTETSSRSRKLKSAPLNVNAKTFSKKNTITSERKPSPFSEDLDSHAFMLKEIKQLESRLEKQILKTNVSEKELKELKQETLSQKTELKLQLDNIKLTINNGNNNKDANILNSKSNNGIIKPQSTNISNITHGVVNVVEQNPGNSNLDFNVVRDIAPSVPTTLAKPQNGRKKVENNYCNTMQTPVQSNYSNTVSDNASYPLHPPVKRKNNPMAKCNLFIVADSRIKTIERDLIFHHFSDKNTSLKYKNFDGADVKPN